MRVIVTKADRDDVRLGLHGDTIATVVGVHQNGFDVTIEPIAQDKYFLVDSKQIREYRG